MLRKSKANAIRNRVPPPDIQEKMDGYWGDIADTTRQEARKTFDSILRKAQEAVALRGEINGLSEQLDVIHQDIEEKLTLEAVELLKKYGYPVEQREHGIVIEGVYLDDYLRSLVKAPELRSELIALGISEDRISALNMQMVVAYLFEHPELMGILLSKKLVEPTKRVTVRPAARTG